KTAPSTVLETLRSPGILNGSLVAGSIDIDLPVFDGSSLSGAAPRVSGGLDNVLSISGVNILVFNCLLTKAGILPASCAVRSPVVNICGLRTDIPRFVCSSGARGYLPTKWGAVPS